MKFFLDSADVDEIQYALDMWDIDGVTTSPERIHAAGNPMTETLNAIGELVAGTNKTVSVPINPHFYGDYQQIINNAHQIADSHPNFVVKIPCIEHGYRACDMLAEEGIRTNMTLGFTVVQVLQAMRMNATYISIYANLIPTDSSNPVRRLIEDAVRLKNTYDFETEILVTAIEHPQQMTAAIAAGADVLALDMPMFREAFNHSNTLAALKQMQADWDNIDGK
jgi:transaldolase